VDAERAVRAPADAVESATAPLSHDPRRQRVLSEVLVAGLAAAAVAVAHRLRR
jgi:hypothetical protein